jgi:hypothetical protein
MNPAASIAVVFKSIILYSYKMPNITRNIIQVDTQAALATAICVAG